MSEQTDPVLEALTTDPSLLTAEDIMVSQLTVSVERNSTSDRSTDSGIADFVGIEAELGRPLNVTEREMLTRKSRMQAALEELGQTDGRIFSSTQPPRNPATGRSSAGQWRATLDYNGSLGGGAPSRPLRVPGIINRSPK